jgi:hypothetical protein
MLRWAEEKEMCPTCPTPTFCNWQKHSFIMFLLFQQCSQSPLSLADHHGPYSVCVPGLPYVYRVKYRGDIDISGKSVLTTRLAILILIRQNTPTKRSYAALLRFELVALEQRRKFQRPGSNARDKSSIQMCRDGRFWVVSNGAVSRLLLARGMLGPACVKKLRCTVCAEL